MSLSQAFVVALFAGLLCAAPAAWACDTAEVRAVSAGTSLDRPVRGAECHRYAAHSQVPLWVEIEETYVGLSVLIGARRIESGVRRPWMEAFLLEPNADGESHFAIQATGKPGLSGSYRLTVRSLQHHPDAAAIRQALDLTMARDPAGAASAWRRAGRPREAAWMLVAQAWTDAYAGRIEASLTLLEDAASLVAETNNEADRARLAIERGSVLNEVRRYEDAAAILAPAVRSAARLEDPSLRAELHLAFGLVRHNRDSLDAARSEYEKAAALLASDPTPDQAVAVILQINLGGIHYLLGEPEAAFARFDQAEASAREIGDDQNYAEALRNQAQLSAHLGLFDRALLKFTEALQLFEARRQTGDVAYALRGIGSTYLGLGLFERSREFLELAIDRAEEAGDAGAAFSARLLLGDVYRHLGQAERALTTHEQALADSESRGRATSAARAAVGWSKDALAAGRAGDAVPRLKHAIGAFRDVGYRRELADALYALGRAHLAGDAARDARVAFEEAERLQRELGDDRALVLTLTRLARLDSEAGDHAKALVTASEAADLLERARGHVSNADLQASFFGSRLQPYDELVRLHLAEGERTGLREPAARAALAAAERSRARALKDLLAGGAVVERRGAAHAELTAKLNGQLMRLRHLQESLDQATSEDARRSVTAELRGTEASLRLLRLELEALDARLAASDPIRRAILAAPPDPDTLGANLPDDLAVLAYYLGEEEATGWLIRQGSITAFSLPPSAELEQAALTAYELASRWDADPEPAYDALRQLGASLLPPLDAEAGLRRIVVVPDGALHRVPFAALPMPGAEHTLLLDHFELTTAPAVGLIDAVPGPDAWPPAGDRMAVFAAPIFETHKLADQVLSPEAGEAGLGTLLASLGPLPYSTEEARRIEGMAKDWRVDVFEGADATKRVLRDPEFAGHEVIHFATHAVMSHEFPELSGLVLSQVDADGRNVDGLLHLQEIYDLPIDAALVVLSACRTGRGRNLRGEGPVSLGRAFLYAGARRVLTTHWGIPDDVTAELMATFYAGILEQGLTPPAALREAQIHILNDPSLGHPFFWAAFALAGTIVD